MIELDAILKDHLPSGSVLRANHNTKIRVEQLNDGIGDTLASVKQIYES